MNRKIQLGIIFGGVSPEHQVSLMSAKNIIMSLDRGKYDLSYIGITQSGQWKLFLSVDEIFDSPEDPDRIVIREQEGIELLLKPGLDPFQYKDSGLLKVLNLDIVFPVLHGTYGEDGCIQGFLEILKVPYVGCHLTSSALCMDKVQSKIILEAQGLRVAPFLSFSFHERGDFSYEKIEEKLGSPFFVKPANMGSSVGISRVASSGEFSKALNWAFEFDSKIIIEKNIVGRELECAVLGNERPKASKVGEVIPKNQFYSYESKYLDEEGATLVIPAQLPPERESQIQELAQKAFRILDCRGMARVDFFLSNEGEIYINELNTIPGFTSISQYPALWQVSGLTYPELLDELVQFGLQASQSKKEIKTQRK